MSTEILLSKYEVVEWIQAQLCCMKQALSLDHAFKKHTGNNDPEWDANIEEHEEAILKLRSTLHHLGAEDDNRPFNPILA